jgi:hypothetical protein
VEDSGRTGRDAVSLGRAASRYNRARGPEFLIRGRAPRNVAALKFRSSLLH